MANQSPRPARHVDKDGVRTIEHGRVRSSVWLLALAMALVGVAVFVVVRPALRRPQMEPGETAAVEPSAPAFAPHATPARPSKAPRPPGAPPPLRVPAGGALPPPEQRPAAPAAAPEPAAATEPAAADSSEPSDQPSGLAVFPPPGTKPIKRGVIVPEGVELPPGYVRHYQTTDSGQQLPAILMFHPDYQPLDEHGAPIPLPEDRVVPPDMVPPGIPLETLDVPEDGAPVPERAGPGRKAPAS